MLTALAPAQAQTAVPPYAFSHLAGPPGGYGNADGTGAAARFWNPSGVAVDPAGNIYVADSNENRIRRITPSGVVTTVPGSAGPDRGIYAWGYGFYVYGYRKGLAVDRSGNIFVADSQNNTISRITPDGVATVLAGTAGQYCRVGGADGTGPAASFNEPSGLTVDNAGNLYVADSFDNVIRKITPDGVVTTIAGTPPEYGHPHGYGADDRMDHPGSADGTGTAAQFCYPSAVAVDGAGNLYVADEGNNTIRKITPGGVVTTLAGTAGTSGSADGTGAAAQFCSPRGVAVDAGGNVYVADAGNGTIRKITPGGVVTTLAGAAGTPGSADGTGAAARFHGPSGLAVDAAGNVYVGDGDPVFLGYAAGADVATRFYGTEGGFVDGWGNVCLGVDRNPYLQPDDHAGTIRKITPGSVVTTLVGQAGARGSVDGAATAARFDNPKGVTADTAGNVYVADELNSTIRKITPSGVVTTLAGTAGQTGSTDGTGTVALFNRPTGVTADLAGNIYVADHDNSTIRKITPAGVVTTLAGTAGQVGSADGTGTAAQFHNPVGLAVDPAGNVYVADGDYIASGDPIFAYGTIRKVTPGGVVTTFAGSPIVRDTHAPRDWWDGTGAVAYFNHPVGVAVNASGTVYVADDFGYIRKITQEGAVTTLDLLDETGAAIQFLHPTGVALDAVGNVYFADNYTSTIRKIAPGGLVTIIGGIAGVRGSADGIGPAAQFNVPGGLAVDSAGNLYVADSRNNAIRKGQLAGPPVITSQPLSQTVAPGSSVQFTVTAGGVPDPTYQWYVNGSAFSGATTNTLSFANARSSDAGDYTVVVTNALGAVTSNAVTLTVSGTPTSSGGGGGGGAPSLWFYGALALLAAIRGFSNRGTVHLS